MQNRAISNAVHYTHERNKPDINDGTTFYRVKKNHFGTSVCMKFQNKRNKKKQSRLRLKFNRYEFNQYVFSRFLRF